MAQIKKILLLSILIVSIFINAGFKVASETETSITVQYVKEDGDNASAILLPPNCTFTADISIKDKSAVLGKPFYFKDYYLLPVKPYSSNYTIKINYSKAKLSGKIVNPDLKTLSAMEGFVVNKTHLKDFIKPRTMNKQKTSYDGTPLARIKVDSTGMYRIFYDEIISMASVNLSSYNPATIKLYNNGIEVPIYMYGAADNVFGPGDYFEFYGERMKGESTYFDKYELLNIYIISAGGGNGVRYIVDNGGLLDDSLIDREFTSTMFTYHFEYDSVYTKIGGRTTIDTTDFWYMKHFFKNESFNVKLPLDGFDTLSSTADIRAYFHGTTYLLMYNPDHIMEFYYDGTLLSTFSWDDLSPYIFEYDSLPITRKDTCEIDFKILPIDTSNNNVAVNWLEVDFLKSLKAISSKMNFSVENSAGFGNFRYRVKNFPNTSVAIYRKDLKRIENYQAVFDSGTNTYEIIFDDQLFSSNREYAVYSLNSFLACDTIEPFMNANLSNTLNEGEFIIITNQNLKSASEPFKNIFEDKHTVKLVGSQEIYDEFSYGKKSALGIRNFLITAYNNWLIPPSNVLILADGSYDNNNHFSSVPNDIPVAFYYDVTGYGMICSDNYYSAISGNDPIEDISISRFPARNEIDINTAIEKASKYLDWRNTGIHDLRVILAYDTTAPGPGLPDYLESKYQSYKLASMLPEYMYPEFMANKHDLNGDFITQLGYGASFMTILAHGAEQSIGSQLFIRLTDVYRMYNMERLPFVDVYSCVTANFDRPNSDSMSIGEAFVSSPYGGAIAYYGSSTASSSSLNNVLSESFLKQYTHNGVKNIGEIALYGELDFYLTLGYIGEFDDESQEANQIRGYGLLGINLVDIRVPEMSDVICSLSSYMINPNDTLKVVLADTQLDDGLIQSIAIDSEDRALAKDYSSLVSGTGENSLIMPDSLVAGPMRVVTMAVTEDTSVLYETYPSVLLGGIKKYYMSPSNPDTLTQFRIYAQIADEKNIANIYAMYKYPTDATYRAILMAADTLDSTLYSTSLLNSIKAESKDQFFYYYISYSDTLNTSVYSTPKKSILIPSIPDLKIASDPYLRPIGLTPYLCVKIQNVGKRSVKNVPVNFYEYVSGLPSLLASDTVSLNANETVESSIPIDKNYFENDLNIFVNPDSSSAVESNYSNNRISTNGFDYFYTFIGSSIIDTNVEYHGIAVDLNTLTDNDSNLIVFSRSVFSDTLSSISPLILFGEEKAYIYSFFTGDTSNESRVKVAMVDSSADAGILEYNDDEGLFYALNEKTASAEICLNRYEKKYLLAGWSDSVAPIISMNIENKEFMGGVVLLNTVNFGCAIEDDEAVKMDKIIIIADGDTLLPSEYNILNTKKDNSIPIKFTREFENGTYSVSVEAEDIFGNKSSKVLSFIVSNQFKIIRIANFPNPVTGSVTRIACDFSKEPESNTLKLYSANGSLIKTSHLAKLKDNRYYMDMDVSGLANGTYFYTIEGSLGDEQVKSGIQKMSIVK
jgi:hypothetical protein